MERFAENPHILDRCRTYMQENALLQSKVVAEKQHEAQKFQDYFDHQELLKKIPSHRALAMFRGRKEGFLQLSMILPEEQETPPRCNPLQIIADITQIRINNGLPMLGYKRCYAQHGA